MGPEDEFNDTRNKEQECNSWDQDCIVVPNKMDIANQISGFHLIPSCEPEDLGPPSKIFKQSPEMRHSLTQPNFINNFNSSWLKHKEFKSENCELLVNPFKVCVIKNFLQESSFIINKLLEECNELCWNKRSLDLYEFFQSVDLKYLHSKYIQIIYTFLKNNIKEWIEKLIGQKLCGISATCSLYGETDYLLLHDDQQEDRLIAFIYYFSGPRDWSEAFGGALQLFNKDELGQPHIPARSIFPCNNQFVFFQVTNDSYHQVTEVTNKNDCRLSINGWFHTKPAPIFNIPDYVPPCYGLFSKILSTPESIDLDLEMWINSEYLDKDTITYIQKQIEEESEISLQNYFKIETFQEILQNLGSSDIKWLQIGPPNRRSYEIALEENLPQVLERFLYMFRSFQMFNLLKQYTDLDLKSVRYELQKWKPGCYSLLTDYDWSSQNELDLVFYLGCTSSSIVGGRTMYISIEEEIQQALITIDPQENNLNIVYRDTARITKYFSKCSTCNIFYLLICSYSE